MAVETITHETLLKQLEHNGVLLTTIHQELKTHKQLIEGAFELDERGLPDYSRHKQHHQKQTQSDKDMTEYKKAITLRLLQGAVGLVLTLLGFGLGPYLTKTLGLG